VKSFQFYNFTIEQLGDQTIAFTNLNFWVTPPSPYDQRRHDVITHAHETCTVLMVNMIRRLQTKEAVDLVLA